ncbi:MAG TPA: hypothetical protein VIY08_04560 [Candidatus Nitrosocosmicus sp.]
MEPLIQITALISLINVIILVGLLIIYIRIYKSSKAVFTLGLMVFSIMMMLHNIIAIVAYFTMTPSYAENLHTYFFGIHVTELVGLIILLKITLT